MPTDAPTFPAYSTVPEMIRDQVHAFGDRELFVCGEQRLTFRAADELSAAVASTLLALGVTKGDRVAVLVPSGSAFVVLWLAITRIGATFVPLSTFSKPRELVTQLADADVRTLVVRDRFLGHDYVAGLETELPELTRAASDHPLRLDALPYLREVLVEGGEPPPWAGRLDIEVAGAALDAGARAALAAVEARVRPSDDAVVLHTSGSTSEPKAVLHTQGTLVRHPVNVNVRRGVRSDDRLYLAMPMFWVAGFSQGLVTAFVTGACIVTDETFRPDRALETIERERATIVSGWPFHAAQLRAEPDYLTRDLSCLRTDIRNLIVPPDHDFDLSAWSSWIGMTETFGAELLAPMDVRLPEHLRGSFGCTIPGLEHRVVDPDTGAVLPDGAEGELQVRGYAVMKGYLGREREEVFTPDGFFPTGDLGHFREGHFFLTGRTSDMIKTAGANVAPAEVEAVLRTFDGVLAAHVVGVPDQERGEIVVAAIVARDPGAVDLDAVAGFVKGKVSAFKVPKHLVALGPGDVPMTPSAKVRRGDLRARLIDRLGLGAVGDEGGNPA
jgi:acyl-CoA synthetase (AMP-forming)/AMP-acid ligase II